MTLVKWKQLRTVLLTVFLVLGFSASASANQYSQSPHHEIDLSTYALPDGTVPVICFGNGSPESEDSHHCDECLSALGKALFSGAQATDVDRTPAVRPSLEGAKVFIVAVDDHDNPARAPPAS